MLLKYKQKKPSFPNSGLTEVKKSKVECDKAIFFIL